MTSRTGSFGGHRPEHGPQSPTSGKKPAPARSLRPVRRTGSTWRVPAALVALSLVPVLAGSARLVELSGGPQLLPPRVDDPSPVPLVVHIVSVIVYAVLGAFQFSAGLRRRRIGWHRIAGRLLVLVGLVVALSALWLTLFYPRTAGGDLLFVFRLLAGSGMAASLVLGVTAIRRRDIARHRAWMIRAYALALGAGTQVFTLGLGEAILGAERPQRSTPSGRGLGDQPRRRRVVHPPAAGPPVRQHGRRVAMSHQSRRGTGPARYELRVDGHLDDHWTAWFDDLTLTHEDDGTTTLRGLVPDQAALHGLLAKVRDLGATLISVEVIDAPD